MSIRSFTWKEARFSLPNSPKRRPHNSCCLKLHFSPLDNATQPCALSKMRIIREMMRNAVSMIARDEKTILFNISAFYWNLIHTGENVQIINAQLEVDSRTKFTLALGSNLISYTLNFLLDKNWEYTLVIFQCIVTTKSGQEPALTGSEEPIPHHFSLPHSVPHFGLWNQC